MTYGVKTLAPSGALIEIDGELLNTPQQVEAMLDQVVSATAASGVTPGDYTNLTATINAQGKIVAAANGSSADRVSVKQNPYNAVGNGIADDRAAIIAAVAAAIAAGASEVNFPPGNYRVSSYISVAGARRLKFKGSAFASIYYGSDNLDTFPSSNALTHAHVRSAFFLQGCQDVSFEDLEFVGGNAKDLAWRNLGSGIYATRCVGTRVRNCRARFGCGLFAQDAIPNTGYTSSNVLAVSAGVVTLTDGSGLGQMHGGMVGRTVTIDHAVDHRNNGVFAVLSCPTSSTITYYNAAAVAENSAGTVVWSVNDGDYDTKISDCRMDDCRFTSYTGSGGTWENCIFTRQMTPDKTGIPDRFTITGTTVTLWDASGSFTAGDVDRYIKVQGSTTANNDGLFKILTSAPAGRYSPASVTYTNSLGVSESCNPAGATWWVAGGERTGIGAGVGAIASTSGVVAFTASAAVFTADDVGKSLCVMDPTSAANAGNHMITRYVSSTVVEYVQSGAVSEDFSGVFSVDGFDNTRSDSGVGPELTSTSTSTSANTLVKTGLGATVNAYAGRTLTEYVAGWPKKQWHIISNTSDTFTLDGGGATPTNGDFYIASSTPFGSSHAIYYFAGRSDITIKGCTFRGVRTIACKVSGGSSPIRNVEISGNTFDECGAGIIAGADDSQEHSNLNFHHNRFINCALGRAGWNDQQAIGVYGARVVKITDNTFSATHDAIASHLSTGAIGGFYQIFAGRYLNGISGPLEDVTISRNTFSFDPTKCVGARISAAYIHAERVGQRAKFGTHGQTQLGDTDVGRSVLLTKHLSGVLTMSIVAAAATCTRTTGSFLTDGVYVGQTVTLSGFTNGGNNVSKIVSAVTATVMTFTSNAGLVDESGNGDEKFSTNVMTLTDNQAQFSQDEVGNSIQICFAPDSGNNSTIGTETRVGDFTVLSVTSNSVLTYYNPLGVGGGVQAGCYRIKPKVGASGRRGSMLLISENVFNGNAPGVQMTSCVGPEVVHNICNGSSLDDHGSVAPHFAYNREIGSGTSNARLTITSTTTWPVIHDNYVANGMLSGGILQGETPGARLGDWNIGVDNTTPVDYPLRGVAGRAKATDAHAELMVGFGSDLVNGDTFTLGGNLLTYKATSPDDGTGGTFKTAGGLIACIDATLRAGNGLGSWGYNCADYGAGFHVPVTTGHVKVSGVATTATADAYYIDTINALNETALVIPRNAGSGMSAAPFGGSSGGEAIQYSRGEGAAGPLGKKFVLWSMQASRSSTVSVAADTAAAATLLAGGWYIDKDPTAPILAQNNSGVCEVLVCLTTTSAEEIRWSMR